MFHFSSTDFFSNFERVRERKSGGKRIDGEYPGKVEQEREKKKFPPFLLLERANFPPLFTLSLSALSWEKGEGSDIALPSLFSETFAPPTNHLRQIFLVLFHLFSNIPAPFSPSQSCFFFLSLSVFLNFGCPPLWEKTKSPWPRFFQRTRPSDKPFETDLFGAVSSLFQHPRPFFPVAIVFFLSLSFCLFELWVSTSLGSDIALAPLFSETFAPPTHHSRPPKIFPFYLLFQHPRLFPPEKNRVCSYTLFLSFFKFCLSTSLGSDIALPSLFSETSTSLCFRNPAELSTELVAGFLRYGPVRLDFNQKQRKTVFFSLFSLFSNSLSLFFFF